MNSRLTASVALGAAVLLGTTGCAFITPQGTTVQYSPSDGVTIPDSGPLKVRNALIVSEEDGGPGNMIAAVVNETDESHTLHIELGEGASAQEITVRVPARSAVSLGNPAGDTPPLEIDAVDGPPGATVPVYFQSGDAEGVLWQVPVLDGALDYYGELLP